jgi:putative DNA primase/helicase
MNIADIQEEFVSAMVKNGIVPSDPAQVVADGTIHRFHVKGDKRSSKNGWAIIFTNEIPAGAYRSLKWGKKHT